ncbi:hypothetical protein KY290_031949 [Solanum tuberosum]|uniref:Gag/pol protein n=1 Tax=Solanum tuberosum TaxID=4113 RepID=A0ABQ7UC92_SOLTU|nr:hypothetical protein KY290_031949 [Solanum tuberosum]
MSHFNPPSTILGQNKLEGSNYVDWRRNLDIVLTAKEYKFKWRKADEMARCYIMASMSNVLQHQHQAMLSAFEILENLKQMFGDQGRSAKQTAMRILMNTKMVEGTPAPFMPLNVEKGSTSTPQGGQKKKKAHKAKAIAPPTGGVKKSKGKCFHCKMPGHWKAHYPVFLAKKKNNPGDSRNAQAD